MQPIALIWTRHLNTAQEIEAFTKMMRHSAPALQAVVDMVQTWENDILKQEMSPKDFDTPAWSEKQAFRNGERAIIQKLKTYLSFINEE